MHFQQTVTALAESLVERPTERLADSRLSRSPAILASDDIALEVLQQQQRMPDYLRPPIHMLTVMFNVAGLVHNRTLFHRATAAQRAAQIASWRNSRIGPCRNFVRFYESLVLLIAFSGDSS